MSEDTKTSGLVVRINTEDAEKAIINLRHEIEKSHEALKAFLADMEAGIKLSINPEKMIATILGFINKIKEDKKA